MQTEKEYTTERSIVGLHSESSGEYPLPDYNGDVKRVLMINPRVVPSGKFISEGNLEFSGAVVYEVVYIDADNELSRAEFSTDYELAVKTDADSYEDSYVTTSVSGYNVRLIGPRKFSAKCALVSNVRIRENKVCEVAGDAFESSEPEMLTATANVITPIFAVGPENEYREEILSLEGAIEDEVKVLLCNIKIGESHVTTGDNGADVKAELDAVIVYKNANSPMTKKCVRIPYSARVEAEGLDKCRSLFGRVEISSLKSETVPDEDGVKVVLTYCATPSVRGLHNSELELVSDAYLKERATVNEYGDFSYSEHICSESAEVNFSAKKAISELTDADVKNFIYVDSIVRPEDCEILDTGVRVKGEIRVSAIAEEESENNTPNYANVKFSLPFDEIVNTSCQMHDNMRVECHVDAYEENIDLQEDNALFTCSLSIFVTLNSQKKQRCLGASYLDGDEYQHEDSVITVYYPDEKESLFDIAKKFHTSVRSIAEDNSLSQSVFASSDSPVKGFGYKKLLIK